MTTDDEQSLVRRAKQGDADAFGTLTKRHQESVKRFVGGRLKGRFSGNVPDVVQDTFVKAWQHIDQFTDRGPESFVKWLRAIAVHLALDVVRGSTRAEIPLEESNENEGALCQLQELGLGALIGSSKVGTLHDLVADVMKSLDYDCRILLIASKYHGIAPVEIARAARFLLNEPDELKGITDEIREWFSSLFGNLERNMKWRRDHCWDLFNQKLDELSPKPRKMGTKKESRGRTDPS